jgi:hypothetical protein
MPVYRIYLLDGAGRIASATEAEYETDDEAISNAGHHVQADAVAEVWQLGRCLGKVRGRRVHNLS